MPLNAILQNGMTEEIVGRISVGRQENTRNEIAQMLEDAKRAKPAGYDEHIRTIRDMYENRMVPRLRTQLRKKYPGQHDKMSPSPMGIVRTAAEIDAQAYRVPPQRWATEENGERIEDDRAERLARLIELSELDRVLPEVERRTMAAKTCFVRLSVSRLGVSLGRQPKIELSPFWPSDVHVIPNPAAPDKLWAALGIFAKVQGSAQQDSEEEWWTLYRREGAPESESDGAPMGRIMVETVSTSGRRRGPARPWHTRDMPWVAFHDGLSPESVFLDADRDIVAMQDAVNCQVSDLWFALAMQGHKQGWAAGTLEDYKGQLSAGGPGTFITFPTGTQVGTLDNSLTRTPVQILGDVLAFWANSRRQPKDAWSQDMAARLSAVARRVMNSAAYEKRDERVVFYRRTEENDLLPALVRLSDARLSAEVGGNIGPVKFRSQFSRPKEIQDPQVQVQNAMIAQNQGWVSAAKASVEAGYYASVEEAISSGVSDDIAGQVVGPENQGGPAGATPSGGPDSESNQGPS